MKSTKVTETKQTPNKVIQNEEQKKKKKKKKKSYNSIMKDILNSKKNTKEKDAEKILKGLGGGMYEKVVKI